MISGYWLLFTLLSGQADRLLLLGNVLLSWFSYSFVVCYSYIFCNIDRRFLAELDSCWKWHTRCLSDIVKENSRYKITPLRDLVI